MSGGAMAYMSMGFGHAVEHLPWYGQALAWAALAVIACAELRVIVPTFRKT